MSERVRVRKRESERERRRERERKHSSKITKIDFPKKMNNTF